MNSFDQQRFFIFKLKMQAKAPIKKIINLFSLKIIFQN